MTRPVRASPRHTVLRLLMRSRYLLSPLRQALRATRVVVPTLSGTTTGGRSVRLRGQLTEDLAPWRRIRLAQQSRLEPWIDTDSRSWAARHTPREWEARAVRIAATHRRGDGLHLAVVVDGQFVGEITLSGIDARHRSAEIGIWLDADVGGAGVASTAARLLVDYAHDTLGLVRLSAPIAVDNTAVKALLVRAGFHHEGTHIAARHVGGRHVDHECWAHVRRLRRS